MTEQKFIQFKSEHKRKKIYNNNQPSIHSSIHFILGQVVGAAATERPRLEVMSVRLRPLHQFSFKPDFNKDPLEKIFCTKTYKCKKDNITFLQLKNLRASILTNQCMTYPVLGGWSKVPIKYLSGTYMVFIMYRVLIRNRLVFISIYLILIGNRPHTYLVQVLAGCVIGTNWV